MGCATPEYICYGRYLKKTHPPNTCLEQANRYRDFLGGMICMNKDHAFVVKDGKIYDSTNMAYTGYKVGNWQVKRQYGNKRDWFCISKVE